MQSNNYYSLKNVKKYHFNALLVYVGLLLCL